MTKNCCTKSHTTLKLVIITTLFLSSAMQVNAAYHRFWRGTKLPTLSPAQFVDAINRTFIPATVQTGTGKGMIAYQPVLLGRFHNLPDEIALVTYSNKAVFSELFSTEAGKKYSALHWDYFDKTGSGSLVPEPFTGTVNFEKAYDLRPEYTDWMKNKTTVLIFLRGEAETDEHFLTRAAERIRRCRQEDAARKVIDRAILISRQYWIEYVSAPMFQKQESANIAIPLQNTVSGTGFIRPVNGVNLRF